MPQKHKKRGRREERKRNLQYAEDELQSKRQKHEALHNIADGNLFRVSENDEAFPRAGDIPFYGLLDDDEQEYFKQADSVLELNQFTDPEERLLFLDSVYKEAQGKELKIANSQSCSRLMERLILMSTPNHLKALFEKFTGHFLHLSQHRFASHCCETLFVQAAPIVTQELTAPLNGQQNMPDGTVNVSMENLFLNTVKELEGNLGYLMTDPFASHTLRVLLTVFSGRSLEDKSTVSLLQSKKKENIAKTAQKADGSVLSTSIRSVPASFGVAVHTMISGMIAGLDTNSLRSLTMHPVANPVLQLSLELDLSRSSEQKDSYNGTLFEKLLPNVSVESDTDTASFLNSLAYDTVGSRLLEVLVTFSPGKTFKTLYKNIFRDKIGSLAKNDVGGFIVIKILDRLNKEDLRYATDQLRQQITLLVQRSRLSIIRAIVENCRVKEIDTYFTSTALQEVYGADPAQRLIKMLQSDISNKGELVEDRSPYLTHEDAGKVHGSLLAQSMLETPGALREFIRDGLLAMETPMLISIAKDRTASRTLQSSLVVSDENMRYRRVLLQRFCGHIVDLATDTIGSRTVDGFWTATMGLTFIRERIAMELLENETLVRESFSGKAVWRNWSMDIYKNRRKMWVSSAHPSSRAPKTELELARARYAAAANNHRYPGKKALPKPRVLTGGNSVAVS